MNLTQFMKQIDANLRKMSIEEKEAFIRELARTLPVDQRESFLAAMAAKPSKTNSKTILSHNREEIMEKLREIADGNICLTGSLNEMYDDWYASNEDEFIYEDPQGVGQILDQAYEMVGLSIENEDYQAAYEMTTLMLGMEIGIEGEYLEYTDEPMSIEDMTQKGLAHFDYEQLIINGLYVAYWVSEPEKRPEILYEIFSGSGAGRITMEKVMQNGKELPETGDFLRSWITYLGTRTERRSQSLLQEALELADDPDALLVNARLYSGQHPGLYEQYLRMAAGKMNAEELLTIGDEALGRIDSRYLVRSRIALLLSSLTSDPDRRERYWLEAYRSDTRVENFLRLYLGSRDVALYLDEMKDIYLQARKQASKYPGFLFEEDELQENKPELSTVQLIGFLCGEFRKTREQEMNEEGALGWSFTFMKCGLAAFLLLLLKGEKRDSGCTEMYDIIKRTISFDEDRYCQGTSTECSDSGKELLWNCFVRWKATVELPEAEQPDYLAWIEELIRKRVNGIMEANKRNYYDECAAYVAAIGEVIESRGEARGKQRIMHEFMDEYPRRSSFRKSLTSYGMIK